SRATQNIDISNLPRYDDFYNKDIKPNNSQQVFAQQQDFSSFNDREFKKQTDKSNEVLKLRVKLFVCIYVIVTLILTGFVIYNLVATALLKNKISSNEEKIKDKIKEVNRVMDRQENESIASILNAVEIPQDLFI
ncbi:MAG: hypothetical protein IJX26_03780, partial [Clostridia bacterium]|nr:hypothetical protein [Clostridia bacterium]